MSYKKLMPIIYLKDKKAYADYQCVCLIGENEKESDAVVLADSFEKNGADEIIIMDMSYDDASHEEAIGIIRQITKNIDIPVIVGGNVKRVEDVKKYLYAGAKTALLSDSKESNVMMMKEVCDRFGADKIGLHFEDYGYDREVLKMARDNKLSCILFEDGVEYNQILPEIAGIPAIIEFSMSNDLNDIKGILQNEAVSAVTGVCVTLNGYDYMNAKLQLKNSGIEMNTFESAVPFSEFKLNSDGLIPVIVQDYKTDEVLMLAYMNEEAYNLTIETGKMTYFSRSRSEIWVKGLTSGHFQYVRSVEIDCDNDTLLAKVKQVGVACHTGNRSCFYRNLVSTEYAQTNPLKVFNDVMGVIQDRKLHPKEGSYTNYLFDKGIDKILKKCGEEAAEIIIAAKNPDPEEIKYEISDFLYHVMVLMVLRGVTWEDIVKELANR